MKDCKNMVKDYDETKYLSNKMHRLKTYLKLWKTFNFANKSNLKQKCIISSSELVTYQQSIKVISVSNKSIKYINIR